MSREEILEAFEQTGATTADFVEFAKSKGVIVSQSSVSRQLNEKLIKNITPSWKLCFALFFESRRIADET